MSVYINGVDEQKIRHDRQLFTMDFWSAMQEEVSIPAVAATLTLPTVTVGDLPAGITVVRAIAMVKFRAIENTNAAVNNLDGATVAATSQVIQVRDDTPGTWRDAITFVNNQFNIAATTREGGDLRQTHFRFGKDDGTEAGHTFWQLEDVNHTQLITADWTFLLRFTEQESGGTAAANTDAVFQYNLNGAGWVDITTTSSVVKAVAVGAFTNGQNCTKRLTGTGTFETSGAGCTEDGSSGGNANDIVASGNSETEAGLAVVFADVANNDTIQLRFRSPDWTVTWTVTPTLTIQKGTTHLGAATLAGIGTLAAIGQHILYGLATLSGIGTVAAIGQRIVYGLVTLAGSGTVACIGTVGGIIHQGAATLSGVGSVVAKAVATYAGKATLAGVGTVVARAVETFAARATLSGTGTVVAVGRATYAAKAVLSGVGTLAAIGLKILSGVAGLAGVGTVTAIGRATYAAKATLSGVGNIVAAGRGIFTGVAALSGVGSVAAAGRGIFAGKATLAGSGSMSAAAAAESNPSPIFESLAVKCLEGGIL